MFEIYSELCLFSSASEQKLVKGIILLVSLLLLVYSLWFILHKIYLHYHSIARINLN